MCVPYDVVVAKLQCVRVGEHSSSDLHNLYQRGFDVNAFGVLTFILVAFIKSEERLLKSFFS